MAPSPTDQVVYSWVRGVGEDCAAVEPVGIWEVHRLVLLLLDFGLRHHTSLPHPERPCPPTKKEQKAAEAILDPQTCCIGAVFYVSTTEWTIWKSDWSTTNLIRCSILARFLYGFLHHPPLATACIPSVVVQIRISATVCEVCFHHLVNIITFLTGICYTKLTIFHRYCAYLLFCFSTIHMIPHLISPIRDGGWSMLNQLYKDERRELSGTPLYSTVFSLALLSLPYFRKRAYELFAYTHIFLAIAYLALLCWHTRGEYMSPTYLYATVVIWALTSLIRGLNHPNLFYSRSLTGFPTKLTHLPGRMTRVSVSVPRGMTWKPGQHAFIRLPQISWFANHPFTIASVPARDDEIMDGRKEGNEVVFLVRAQRGFTRRLGEGGLVEGIEETSTSPAGSGVVTPIASNIEIGGDVEKVVQEKVVVRGERKREKEGRVKRLALRTIIDGPYGGHARPLHRLYDTVVCVAGGSGITAVLPQLLTISRAMRDDEVRTTRLHLVWMIRSAEWIGWVREEIKTVLRDARDIKGKARVGIEVFVTAGGEDILVGSEEDVGLRSGSAAEMRKSVEMPICPSPVYGGVGRTKGSRGWSYEMMVAMGNQDQARAVEVGKMESGPVELNEMLMVSYQKPILSGVLGRLVDGNRAIVLSCGPESMKADLSNAVARLQRRVLEGKMQEVALHTETFDALVSCITLHILARLSLLRQESMLAMQDLFLPAMQLWFVREYELSGPYDLTNDIEDNVPSEDDPDVIYYGPGVHSVNGNQLNVPSGKTVYLAGGAVLTANVYLGNVTNAGVRGRGILYNNPAGAIKAEYSSDISIEGVTMPDPNGYAVTVGEVKGLTIRNVHSFSSKGNGDGIDLFCCQDTLIDGVFMRNSDDNMAIYQHRWNYSGDSRNITIQNSALWADVAHPSNIGTHGNTPNPETMSDVTIRNIDILDHREFQMWYQGCIAINPGDDNFIQNVHIEDIRVEDFRLGRLVSMRITYNTMYNTSPGRGIENVTIKDLSYTGENARPSLLLGYNEERGIKFVKFQNLTINGKLISDTMAKPAWYYTTDYFPMFANEHVANLTFEA
ncbi:pectin lyase-like protein [Lophium mytilinum]|uniref:ferric-chelate reductase (NADPH) n=1 Tax=Lophium mytilinum TaxID=390894 RepID=A0A6A6R534_9PEZI|nr:pectin lyase-like protein [Lophium mytilinum]